MTSHKRKHERRHIRSSGVLGLNSSFLVPKEELEESSNDDLMDYSAISSKNSSLSASPTTQQSSTVPYMLPHPTTTMCSSHSVKPTARSASSQPYFRPAVPGSTQQRAHGPSTFQQRTGRCFQPLLPPHSQNAHVAQRPLPPVWYLPSPPEVTP